jgi:hypothetical protein
LAFNVKSLNNNNAAALNEARGQSVRCGPHLRMCTFCIIVLRVGKKHVFFLFKTKHTVFFLILNSFFCLKHVLNLVKKTCFKPILNTNKTALNRLKSLLYCCTFTLDHWACALRSYIAMQTAKLPKFRFLIIFSCYL